MFIRDVYEGVIVLHIVVIMVHSEMSKGTKMVDSDLNLGK